ncbi:LysR family transcriptional regulator [Piscinibacter sp.]|uniref:LysR family transcriptional regulator n=1 Tax=Piscinibacter sp. TaxID=1903157 RepID=UPI002F419CED
MNRSWDLDDLEVFCGVAKRSSFTAAATDLGISPAYVTKRIARLERALGVTLFHRTTRRVHISTEGEIAYAWARKMLDAADGMHSEVASAKGSPTGTLRLSTSLRLGRNHVSHILSLLRKKHPALDIWLELVDRRVDLIAEGFDIDIRVGEVSEPHLVARKIAPSARILCAAPAYLKRRGRPRTLAELAQHDCLLFRDREQAFGVLRMEGPNGAESVKVTGPLGSNHSDPVRNWALAGHGIVLLSSWDIAEKLRDGSVERVLPQYRQSADVYAVMPTRASHLAKLSVCVDFLVKHLTQGPYALDTAID